MQTTWATKLRALITYNDARSNHVVAVADFHDCGRVLCEGGRFISITFDQPHFRKPFLQAAGLTWDVQLQTFGEGLQYFVYTMQKGALSQSDIAQAPRDELQKAILPESMNHQHMEHEDYLLQMDI